jgi:hypothetical protein
MLTHEAWIAREKRERVRNRIFLKLLIKKLQEKERAINNRLSVTKAN